MWPLVATWTTDINTDYSCERTTEPDMVLVHSPGLDVIVALAGITGHPDQMASMAVQSLNASMSSDSSPDPGLVL